LAVDHDGTAKTTVGVVASIKIGGMEFTNCRVKILPKDPIVYTGEFVKHPEGFVGMDVFQGSLLTMDFPNHELRLAPLPERPGVQEVEPTQLNSMGDETVKMSDAYFAPEMAKWLRVTRRSYATGSVMGQTTAREAGKRTLAFEAQDAYVAPEMAKWTRIYRVGHELLVPTSVVDTSRMKDQKAWKDGLFLLVTGDSENSISLTAAEGTAKLSPYGTTRAGFVEGQTAARETGKLSLAFGGLVLDSESMLAVDMANWSHDNGVEVSGVIGAPALTQLVVHIDYRDNLVIFEHAPKK
jgi:hypothetical protein